MPDLLFFYSANDPSVAMEALNLEYCLLVNKDYGPDEDLIIISSASNLDNQPCRNYYVLPNKQFASEISMGYTRKIRTGKDFCYIKDRIGAAAIALTLNDNPSNDEVSVGDLQFAVRTYRSDSEPLEPRPPVFSSAFRKLRSFIKRSAQPVPNRKFPKTVYVFPQAMALLREDFSRSPWPSIEITG